MTRERKTVISIMVAVMLLVASPAYTEACFVDGLMLMEWYKAGQRLEQQIGGIGDVMDDSKFKGYIIGVIDAADEDFYHYDIPHGTMIGQIYAIVIKYLKANPKQWRLCGSELVILAMMQAYPKRK
jgi:hypothetical protein